MSQDMSLHYLGKWDVQTHGFTDEMFLSSTGVYRTVVCQRRQGA